MSLPLRSLEDSIRTCDNLRRRAVVGESAADPFDCSRVIDVLLDQLFTFFGVYSDLNLEAA